MKRAYLSKIVGILNRIGCIRNPVDLRVVDQVRRGPNIRDGFKNAHVRIDGRMMNAGGRQRLKPCAVGRIDVMFALVDRTHSFQFFFFVS